MREAVLTVSPNKPVPFFFCVSPHAACRIFIMLLFALLLLLNYILSYILYYISIFASVLMPHVAGVMLPDW
jgi:hypothetical protein